MKNYLNNLSEGLRGLIHLAGDVADKNKVPAYLVGGCVRDLILGAKNFDLDIVIEGDGIKFAEAYASVLKARLIRHRRFGTATIILGHNLKTGLSASSFDKLRTSPERSRGTLSINGERSRTIDITSSRREVYPGPASLPEVRSGRLRDDLARRDFTINAMAISINSGAFGKLIDFFNGQSDLRHKKIRVLHKLSFIDDPTRILRAVRFGIRYNFRIERDTLKLLKEAKRLKMVEMVQPQRLRDELILTLKEANPVSQIKLLQELAGFAFVNPRLSLSKKAYNLLVSIQRQIAWFEERLPGHRKLDTWLIYFMGLIDPLKISAVKSVCRNFVFRKGEEKRILSYKKHASKIMSGLVKDKIKPSMIFALLEPLSYEAIIMLRAKSKDCNLRMHIEDFLEIYNGMRICLSGDDLHRLGVAPGPYYRRIFAKVLQAKLNGLINTPQEELVLIKKFIKRALKKSI